MKLVKTIKSTKIEVFLVPKHLFEKNRFTISKCRKRMNINQKQKNIFLLNCGS